MELEYQHFVASGGKAEPLGLKSLAMHFQQPELFDLKKIDDLLLKALPTYRIPLEAGKMQEAHATEMQLNIF